MVGSALLFMITVLIAVVVVLLGELKFLIPYERLLYRVYGGPIAGYTLVFCLNTFSLAFVLLRRFWLKNTGQKLVHVDKQLKTGQSALSEEIKRKFRS